MTELYCVLHKNPCWPREKTAAFLAAELCVARPVAEETAWKSPGFLLQDASLTKAAAFNMRASAFGLETVLISQLDLKSPPPALRVSKIEPGASGFYYTAGAVREHISFESVLAVSAGAFSVELPPADPGATLKDALTAFAASLQARYLPFLPQAPEPPPGDGAPSPRETIFFADILSARLRLSLSCEELDYSGLGPGKSLSSFENFRALLSELTAPAPKAARNSFLEAFVKKESLSRLKHQSQAAYEKELVWLSTISSAGAKAED